MLDLQRHLAASRKELERFGLLFAAVMALITLYLAWKGSSAWPALAIAGTIFLALRLTMPMALRPLYVAWMIFGSALGWINTRVLLGVIFYVVLTPTGLVLRLFGKDHLGVKLDRTAATYWIARPPSDRGRERYEQLF